ILRPHVVVTRDGSAEEEIMTRIRSSDAIARDGKSELLPRMQPMRQGFVRDRDPFGALRFWDRARGGGQMLVELARRQESVMPLQGFSDASHARLRRFDHELNRSRATISAPIV